MSYSGPHGRPPVKFFNCSKIWPDCTCEKKVHAIPLYAEFPVGGNNTGTEKKKRPRRKKQ